MKDMEFGSTKENNGICVSMFVSEKYAEYIPLFLYFMIKAYPENYSVIGYKGQLCDMIKNLCNENLDCSKFIIRDNLCNEHPSNPDTVKILRWCIKHPEHYKYKYSFIGDIDIFTMKEKPSMLERHLNVCKKYNSCFSNTTGIDDISTRGLRVTGLHFFKSDEYFSKMDAVMEKYYHILKSRIPDVFFNNIIGRIDNQHALYIMLREAGFEVPVHNHFYYHGLHLGHSRVHNRWNLLFQYGNKNEADYKSFYNQFSEAQYDSIYRKLYDSCSDSVKWEINCMSDSMRSYYGKR